jgi:predicted ATPase
MSTRKSAAKRRSPVSRKPRRTTFVGRRAVMERLEALLDEAVGGSGRIVTISGEAGIGKTRVAEELCALARPRGIDVAWGSCYDGEGAPLTWPWSLVMRDLIEARGAAGVRKHLGRGAQAVAAVIPSVADALPDLGAPKALDNPAMARFRVFDAMSSFLRRASAERPIAIVLDDLHWADEPTLGLLSFLSRDVTGSTVLLVVTYRDVEVHRRRLLEETLGDLARERGHEHVALHRLGVEDVRRFLEAAGGASGSAGRAEAVHARMEGNPFLLAEMARLLVDEPGALDATRGGGALPEAVREVLGKRLDRLSAGCAALLTLAAGLGREFDSRILGAVRGQTIDGDLLVLLDEALGSGLVEEAPGTAGRWRFGHALTRQTLLARLPPGERARLHARIAGALELEYGERVDANARELVEHLERARPVLRAEKLVRYLGVAGEQALASYAWEEARELFSRAVELRQAAPDDTLTADLLFGLGRAQSALSDNGAVASCSRAFGIYDKAGKVHRAVEVATSGIYGHREHWEAVFGMGERALDLVEKGSLDEAAVLSEFALWGLASLGAEERRQRLLEALAVARRKRAVRLEAETLFRLFLWSKTHLDYEAAAGYAKEEHALAMRTGDLLSQCRAALALV